MRLVKGKLKRHQISWKPSGAFLLRFVYLHQDSICWIRLFSFDQIRNIRSVSMLYIEDDIRKRFSDSEMMTIQKLVKQECRNGIVTEKRLRKLYADIFPMVNKQQYFLCQSMRIKLGKQKPNLWLISNSLSQCTFQFPNNCINIIVGKFANSLLSGILSPICQSSLQNYGQWQQRVRKSFSFLPILHICFWLV